MIRVASASHYFQPIDDESSLPSLDDRLRELCRENFRRIDRFIQLALLGSARCVTGRQLQTDCGIYLGSGLGPIGNNVVTQQQLIRDREIPKPFNFINTLGSSAGFYVARNLGLSGQNFFVSRRGASLDAVMCQAVADLTLGIVRQALIGVVEEVVLPLAGHRKRQRLPETAALSEGSHWLLLQADGEGRRQMALRRFANRLALLDFLKPLWKAGDQLLCARSVEPGTAEMLCREVTGSAISHGDQTFHDSLEAAWVTEYLTGDAPGNLMLASGDDSRGWSLFHFGP